MNLLTSGDAIVVGIGANLPSRHGEPLANCQRALGFLDRHGLAVARRSRWYVSRPEPASDQPWFVNGIAVVTSALGPAPLLAALLAIEQRFGRLRGGRWAARPIDLDLIAYGREIGVAAPILPHPRLHERAFVLAPLAEVLPGWRHPVTGRTADSDLAALENRQIALILP